MIGIYQGSRRLSHGDLLVYQEGKLVVLGTGFPPIKFMKKQQKVCEQKSFSSFVENPCCFSGCLWKFHAVSAESLKHLEDTSKNTQKHLGFILRNQKIGLSFVDPNMGSLPPREKSLPTFTTRGETFASPWGTFPEGHPQDLKKWGRNFSMDVLGGGFK